MVMNRRGFLTGLVSALAAPAVVRSGILMPLRGIVVPALPNIVWSADLAPTLWSDLRSGGYLYSDELSDALRQSIQPLTKFKQICEGELGRYDGIRIIG